MSQVIAQQGATTEAGAATEFKPCGRPAVFPNDLPGADLFGESKEESGPQCIYVGIRENLSKNRKYFFHTRLQSLHGAKSDLWKGWNQFTCRRLELKEM